MEQYYKVLKADGSCHHGGRGVWPEGEWMPALRADRLLPCSYGYHILRREDVVYWLGPAIATVEIPAAAAVIRHENKSVVAEARRGPFLVGWNERTQRLFAADCAERGLPLFEARRPDDARPRRAIEAARAFARGEIGRGELRAAAYAAHAAYAAADYAAYAAAYAAASAAADAAADYATAAYARADERAWQTERLWEYLDGVRG